MRVTTKLCLFMCAIGWGLTAFASAPPVPLVFEAHQNQQFIARAPGQIIKLAPGEIQLSASRISHERYEDRLVPKRILLQQINIEMVNANQQAAATPIRPSGGVSHYLTGKDRQSWRTQVKHYQAVRYQGVYPGIDVVYHGPENRLRYDFEVAPHADPKLIQLKFTTTGKLSLAEDGSLQVKNAQGVFKQLAPVSYQDIDGQRQAVESRYQLLADNRVSFQLGQYDTSYPLTIDPTLDYASYLGANSFDAVSSVTKDNAGNIIVSAYTDSTDFPTLNAIQSTFAGASTISFPYDLAVTKLTPDGSSIIFSTYIGGSGGELPQALITNASNEIIIGGRTNSTDFPVFNAFQPTYAGGVLEDAFLFKLTADGSSFVFSTYFGGVDATHVFEEIREVILDDAENILAIGNTAAPDFPATHSISGKACADSGMFREADIFIAKFNPTGGLTWATCFGGTSRDSGRDLAFDHDGNLVVSGWTESLDFPTPGGFQTTHGGTVGGFPVPIDAWVAKINADATSYLFGSYHGGNGIDYNEGLTINEAGLAVLSGSTASTDFVLVDPIQGVYGGAGPDIGDLGDGWVAAVNTNTGTLVKSSYIGGSGDEMLWRAMSDSSGNLYFGGYTESTDFPLENPLQATLGGARDSVFVVLDSALSEILFSTYFGGSDGEASTDGIHINSPGSILIAGSTSSTDLPVVNPYQAAFAGGTTDGFIAEISFELDDDGDGVPNDMDACPGTVIPESVPTITLKKNRYALADGDEIFDGRSSPTFTTTDTGGCSCEQIIDQLDLGKGHSKFGCSKGAIEDWIATL